MVKDKEQARGAVWGTQGLINKGLTIRVNFKVRSNEGKIV